ncbi:LamG domain-containing protein [Klebsiella aerogenes]|uniref:LamG-like jellyroll fold domain-containing protein n=1 Tax=Klebsiella aerogenes TaxID=548 RepID=UPI0023BA047B|nr:LamG-like jellyroll fold domain-containing protein [Klebsiella aerogenes]MCL9943752.1 LamG domain-containing protein [Klebsiella aerogenes]
MILVCDGVVNAGDLELAEPEMMLNDSASIATYGMQDKYDSSGNGYDLVTDNDFTLTGMRTVADGEHGANTGITETDEMTFAVCINMDKPNVSGRIFSNLSPGVAPFGGIQLRIEADGQLILQMGTGNTVEAVVSVTHGGAVGGWTRFTVTVSSTEITITRASGDKHSTQITARKKSTLPIMLNGGVSAEQNMGLPGIMGIIAVYNRVLSADEQTEKRALLKEIMALRGVSVS